MIPCTLRPSGLPCATASRSMSPVEIAGTPRREASTTACVPLPAPGGPSSTMFAPAAPPERCGSAASATDQTFLHEAFVVAHHELALDLLDRVHRDADHDEQRGAAEVELDPHALGDPGREMRG